MSDAARNNEKRVRGLSARSAIGFIILFGIVSLFADMTYEGGRSMVGQYLKILGATAAAVGVSAGAGELLGYVLRLGSGYIADRTKQYWAVTIIGYAFQLFALPLLAFIGQWEIAIAMVFAERIGKAIRNPSRDALLGYATSQTGRGFGFGLHEAMDQIGAFLGPLILSGVLFLRSRQEAIETGSAAVADYQAAFLILFIPAGLAILFLVVNRFVFPKPQDFELKSKIPQIANKGFPRTYWLFVIASGLLAAGITDFPLIAFHFKSVDLIPDFWIPTMYAVAMAVDGAAALLFGWLYDKRGFSVLLIMFTLEAFTAPFVFLGGVPGAVAGMALWGISMGAQESIMKAAIADVVSADKRATAYGMFHTVYGIAWLGGSALMGFLYDWSVYAIVIFSLVVQLSAIPVFLIANRVRKTEIKYVEREDSEETESGDTSTATHEKDEE